MLQTKCYRKKYNAISQIKDCSICWPHYRSSLNQILPVAHCPSHIWYHESVTVHCTLYSVVWSLSRMSQIHSPYLLSEQTNNRKEMSIKQVSPCKHYQPVFMWHAPAKGQSCLKTGQELVQLICSQALENKRHCQAWWSNMGQRWQVFLLR